MATGNQLREAERAVRDLLADNKLPQPNAVVYRSASIVLLWHDQKLAVVVEAIPQSEDRAPPARSKARMSSAVGFSAGALPDEDT